MQLFNKLQNYFFGKQIDVFSSFKTFLCFFRIYGTLPYSLSPKNELKIHRLETWISFIVYQSMAVFLLITWILKLESKKLLVNPFMLLSFVRSMAYFTYICLYAFNVKANHERNENIFRKLKKINGVITLKRKQLKNLLTFQIIGSVLSVAAFPFVLYIFMRENKTYRGLFTSFSMIMTLILPNSTEAHFENLLNVCVMFLDETLEQLKHLSRAFPKSKRFEFK